ncbi:MAG: adenylyltransferase/cytidyltransferase family protein [Candidatus Nanohaloarchaea archaeon]|nr:adenylyltransferase/cytidyltransferase family protein [Candidatus Nanohaloarchaea archaeon]
MRAAFIGRFQVFHRGHHRVVEEYRDRYDDFVLVMGSPEKSRTEDNPMTAGERKDIIRACFPNIDIIELEDEGSTEEDNQRWAAKLGPETGADVIISQNDLVKRLVTEYTDLELVEQELYDPDVYSGTEIRRRIRAGEDWRELVPACAVETVEEHVDVIRETKEG